MWSVTVFIIAEVVIEAFGHGSLLDPPSRSSAWHEFNTPRNYDETALNCGGLDAQQRAGGKCGVCGDPYTGTRANEAGGKYATGLIVRNYTIGQVIKTRAKITANHMGWMEYRICPNNNYRKEVTQECLDQHVLLRADGRGTKVDVPNDITGYFDMDFQLPYGMVCSQCVIQWKYHAGNNWGWNKDTHTGCIGCGAQEEFYGCADVSISDGSSVHIPDLPSTIKPETPTKPTMSRPLIKDVTQAKTTLPHGPLDGASSSVSKTTCYAINELAGNLVYNKWCADHCPTGDCPSHICACPKCHAIGSFVGNAEIDRWCVEQCAIDLCPPATCACPVTTHHLVVTTPTTVTTTASPTTTTTVLPTTTTTASTTKDESTKTMDTTPTVEYIQYHTVCKAVNMWEGNDYLDRWCADSCARGNCPADSCQCNSASIKNAISTTTLNPSSQTLKECKALSLWQGIDTFDRWCTERCNTNNCPEDMCACTNTVIPDITRLQTIQHQMQSSTAARRCASKQSSSGEFDWDTWCQNNCNRGTCPSSYCLCDL